MLCRETKKNIINSQILFCPVTNNNFETESYEEFSEGFGLERKTPKRKLCRVRIDINNKSDLLWQLDVKKSSAVPPPVVKRRLKKILRSLLSPAERNFNNQARRLTNREINPIWERAIKDRGITCLLYTSPSPRD